jgi:hypothetical protein
MRSLFKIHLINNTFLAFGTVFLRHGPPTSAIGDYSVFSGSSLNIARTQGQRDTLADPIRAASD